MHVTGKLTSDRLAKTRCMATIQNLFSVDNRQLSLGNSSDINFLSIFGNVMWMAEIGFMDGVLILDKNVN